MVKTEGISMKQETPEKFKTLEKKDVEDIKWHLDYVVRSLKTYGKEPIDVDFYLGHVKKAALIMEKYKGD